MEQTENSKTINKTNTGKKPNPFVKILQIILVVLLSLFAAIGLWIAFSCFNKAKSISLYPKNYDVFVHTDSLYETVNPLLDLKAAEMVLADPELGSARQTFMAIKSSEFRNSKAIQKLLSREINAAVYGNGKDMNFIATAELGILSSATRLAPLAVPFLNIPGLSTRKVEGKARNAMVFDAGEKKIYIKCFRNLVFATDSIDLLKKAFDNYTENEYTEEDKNILTGKEEEPLKITLNSRKFAQEFLQENSMLASAHSMLGEGTKSVITVKITDEKITVKTKLPLNHEKSDFAISKIFEETSRDSNIPKYLGESTQYYTTLNLCSLEKIKNAVFEELSKTQDVYSTWETANKACNTVFSLSLEDLVFSWAGTEIGVAGIEGSSDPVFILQIRDKRKFKTNFNKFTSSILIKNDTGLILNNTRIPYIGIPSFISGILKLFGVNLPKAYYNIIGDYIYFSLSPVNLSKINMQLKEKKSIHENEFWAMTNSDISESNSVAMFYNLKRSIPFFITKKSLAGKILALYNIGRCEMAIKDDKILITLNAVSVQDEETKIISGFPVSLEGKNNSTLLKSSDNKLVYWIERDTVLCSLNTTTLKVKRTPFPHKITTAICSSEMDNKGQIWALTEYGAVYLFDKNLEMISGFPIRTNMIPTSPCAVSNKELTFATEDKIIFISSNGKEITEIKIDDDMPNFKTAPAISGKSTIYYSRGFEGNIYTVDGHNLKDAKITVDGIGSSSPCCLNYNNTSYMAFVNQRGDISIFKNGMMASGFPKQLDGIFKNRIVSLDDSFYTISTDGYIHKISVDGKICTIKLPDVETSEEGFIYAETDSENKGIYVCGDNNILYGFNTDMEVMSAYPINGRGQPAFIDVNGDNKKDCIVLSLDKKIYGWNLK
ncbi:MAG: hypothetical protein SOZ72_04775 [Treponema sp.]|nr:hypothetical protein [Treponema sp.]